MSPSVPSRLGSFSTPLLSMTFGLADRRKWDVAEGVALAAGHLRHAVGTGSARSPSREAPIWMLLPRQAVPGCSASSRAVRDPELEPTGSTSVGAALGLVGRLASFAAALMVVVSDFRGPRDWRSAPASDSLARHAVDRRRDSGRARTGAAQRRPNYLWLVDPETGRRLQVDTGRKRMRERFAAAAAEERTALAQELASLGASSRALHRRRLAPHFARFIDREGRR